MLSLLLNISSLKIIHLENHKTLFWEQQFSPCNELYCTLSIKYFIPLQYKFTGISANRW